MPLKTGELTAQETVFVEAMARTGDTAAADRAAGYIQGRGSAKMRHPRIVQAVEEFRAKLLSERDSFLSEAVPLAYGVIMSNLRNDKQPLVQERAAARVVDMATARLAASEGEDAGDPANWDAAELARQINRLERLASERAVDVTPNEPDIFG